MIRQEYLESILEYNPVLGQLKWLKNTAHLLRGQIDRKGKIAGKCGNIRINGQAHAAHVLAWMLYYGERPLSHIQFADRDKTNIKIENMADSGSRIRRFCSCCGQEGGAGLFSPCEHTISGLASKCRDCVNNKTKKRRKTLKDEHKVPPMFMPPIVQRSLGMEE